jgi:hypothetical protein
MSNNRCSLYWLVISFAACFVASAARAEESESDEITLSEFKGTYRGGILSGGYFAVDVGLLAVRQRARERVGIGLGPGFDLRAGAAFWDHLVIGAGLAIYTPADNDPTSELVITCTTFEGQSLGCSGPSRQDSGVAGSFASFESGYQHRFRPWINSSLTPGAVLGFTAELHPPSRGVACEGCPDSVALPVSTSGVYAAPFFRVTIGERGNYAVVARSQIFLTSDLAHFTTLGAEMGLP